MNFNGFNISVRGYSHILKNTVCQDSSRCFLDGDFAVVAISDGHGSAPHFRSDMGSEIAVRTAVRTVCDFFERNSGLGEAIAENPEKTLRKIEANILLNWNEEVCAHYTIFPFTEEESKLLVSSVKFTEKSSDITPEAASFVSHETPPSISHDTPSNVSHDTPSNVSHDTPSNVSHDTPLSVSQTLSNAAQEIPLNTAYEKNSCVAYDKNSCVAYDKNSCVAYEKAYGATLIVGVITKTHVFGIQIGDGGFLLMQGEDMRFPMPDDLRLIANFTTSLCDGDAINEFRHFCVPIDACSGVFLCSDGLINSFASEADYTTFARRILTEKTDISALQSHLSERSEKGSRDDISISCATFEP